MTRRDQALAVIAKISKRAVSNLTPELELVADLDIDSAKAVVLLLELEQALGIEVSDAEVAGMDTVGRILDYVEGLS